MSPAKLAFGSLGELPADCHPRPKPFGLRLDGATFGTSLAGAGEGRPAEGKVSFPLQGKQQEGDGGMAGKGRRSAYIHE